MVYDKYNVQTFFVISYILLCPANRMAAVKTLCTNLLPTPLYSPPTPSSFKMASNPSNDDLYFKAAACPACNLLLMTLHGLPSILGSVLDKKESYM